MEVPKLGTELMRQLMDACHELEEFGNIEFISLDTEKKKIVLSFDYGDPEENGNGTIFCNY
jgi:hypothetical protein